MSDTDSDSERSESSSRETEDDRSSTDDSSDEENGEPHYKWNKNKRAWVNDHGRTIFWVDGSCKGNHLGPKDGATSGVGVWVNTTTFWKKSNSEYDHTNNVSRTPNRRFGLVLFSLPNFMRWNLLCRKLPMQ